MNPLEAQHYCPRDDARMEWLWSMPTSKEVGAVYESGYQCPICGHQLWAYSFDIRFSELQLTLDFGALG